MRRRLTLLTTTLAFLVAVGAVLAWVVLAYMPIRDGVAGQFAAWSQTPAESSRAVRRAVPDSKWPERTTTPPR